MSDTLVDHIESHLGTILSGWSTDADGEKLPFQVALCRSADKPDVCSVVTLGLSNAPLRNDKGGYLRQELLLMFRESDGPQNLPGVLQQLALEAIAHGRSYRVGQVIGPRGALRDDTTMASLYVSLPVYVPDSFQVYEREAAPIVFGWMVPITEAEAAFARANGRDAFEDALVASDPDLLDFHRPSIANM